MKSIKAIVNNYIKQHDNRGFSLVEMVAALVIMSLIGLGVGGLIVSGSKYFNRSTAETELQEEAQLVKNYLNNMIVDTALAIGRIDNFSKQGNSCVFVCSPNEVRFIALDHSEDPWDSGTNDYAEHTKCKLLYLETTFNEATKLENGRLSIDIDKVLGKYPLSARPYEGWVLLAEHVKSFDVTHSLAKINKKFRIFNCDMNFEVRDRQYKTKHTINLRNDIFNVDDMDLTDAYAFIDFHQVTVTGVTIDPMSESATRGGVIEFHSSVVGQNFPSQAVTWEVSSLNNFTESESAREEKSDDTIIDSNGVLQIALDEPCSVLYVRATSVLDEDYAAIARVRIATVNSVSIAEEKTANAASNAQGKYDAGMELLLALKVNASYMESTDTLTKDAMTYNWEVKDIYIPADVDYKDEYINNLPVVDTGNGRYYVEENIYGNKVGDRVRVTQDDEKEKCKFFITADMLPNSIIHVSASVTISGRTVVASNAPFAIPVSDKEASGLVINAAKDSLNRNGSLTVEGIVTGDDDAYIDWEIIVPSSIKGKVGFDKTGQSTENTGDSEDNIPAVDDITKIRSRSKSPIRIYADNTIDYTMENLAITLKATHTKPNGTVIEERIVIPIPPVSIAFEPEIALMVAGNPARIDVVVVGLEADVKDITFKSSSYIKGMVGPIYSPVNKKLVVSVNPPETVKKTDREGFPKSTIIKATMNNSPSVTGSINVVVHLSNITLTGKNYCYVPVPGDVNFPKSTNDANLPKENDPVKMINGYDNAQYFVEGDEWGVKVPNPNNEGEVYKYYYDKTNMIFNRR